MTIGQSSANNSLFVFDYHTFVVEGCRRWMYVCDYCKITLQDKSPDPSTCVSFDQCLKSSVSYVGDLCVAGGEAAAMKKYPSNLAFCFCVVLVFVKIPDDFFQDIVGAFMHLL